MISTAEMLQLIVPRQIMKYDDKESISNDQSMGSIFHQRCNGVNDCPQTESLSGGEDEEGCEGSGQVRMIMLFFLS